MSLYQKLKRRNVFRVAAAYVVTGWLLIEVGNTLEETLRLPDWTDTLLAFFLILGFPVAVFFSWAFEITPEGVRRESEIEPDEGIHAATGRKLDRLIMVVLVLALGYFVSEKYLFQKSGPEPTPETVQVVEKEMSQPVPDTVSEAVEPADSVSDQSIAVLPFVNMSSDPEQEFFSDGLTEELLNLLAGIGDLKVAARTSSFFYKDKLDTIPMKEVARQLEVAHILEGSVRKGGNQIRITAQLIKADDGFHLWSETYDRTLDDIFAIQDEIAAAVVHELKITLLGEAPHASVIDPVSYEKSLEGRFLFNRRAEGDMERALQLFEEAVELDPNNADAWVGMAPLYLWMFDPPRIADSRAATEKALNLDPDNPEAMIRYARTYNWEGRREEGWTWYVQALELGQSNPLVLGAWAGIAGMAGDLEGALDFQRRALEADPLHIVNMSNLCDYLIRTGRLAEAEAYALKSKDIAPSSDIGDQIMARILMLKGDFEQAKVFLSRVRYTQVGSQGNNRLRFEAMIEHSLGNEDASNSALTEFKSKEKGAYGILEVATIYAWRGEKDRAFEWLSRALDEQPELGRHEMFSPFLAKLHDDPRWEIIKQRWKGPDWAERYWSEWKQQ